MRAAATQPKDTRDEDTGADEITLAALQSQLNDLKQRLGERDAAPIEARTTRLEDALLGAADLFADLRLSCFGSDRRETVQKVAALAAAIRTEREGKNHAQS